jgi:hypothetical protein
MCGDVVGCGLSPSESRKKNQPVLTETLKGGENRRHDRVRIDSPPQLLYPARRRAVTQIEHRPRLPICGNDAMPQIVHVAPRRLVSLAASATACRANLGRQSDFSCR